LAKKASSVLPQTLATVPGGPRISLFGLVAGQASRDILPSAEEFYLGGQSFTRGFYAGEATGDRALAATAELRLSGQYSEEVFGSTVKLTPQLYAFYDWGETWQNQATDADHRLRSYGLGLRTGITAHLEVDLEVLRRITRQIGGGNTSPDAADAKSAARPCSTNAPAPAPPPASTDLRAPTLCLQFHAEEDPAGSIFG